MEVLLIYTFLFLAYNVAAAASKQERRGGRCLICPEPVEMFGAAGEDARTFVSKMKIFTEIISLYWYLANGFIAISTKIKILKMREEDMRAYVPAK